MFLLILKFIGDQDDLLKVYGRLFDFDQQNMKKLPEEAELPLPGVFIIR